MLVSTGKIKENLFFYIEFLRLVSSGMSPNDVHLFLALQHFLTEKLFNDVEEVKACLNHCFAKKTVVRYNSSMHMQNSIRKIFRYQKLLRYLLKFGCFFISC